MGLFGDDVNLCPSGGDILLCPARDIEVCTECEVLHLSGPEAPILGSEYTAIGGSGELIFSFSNGSINQSGMITAIDSCGASGSSRVGTVTVTDSCTPTPQTASITVRLPDGKWVANGNETYYSGGADGLSGDLAYLCSACCGEFTTDDYADQQVKLSDNSWTYPYFLNGDGTAHRETVFQTDNVLSCSGSCTGCSYCGTSDAYAGIKACASENRGELVTDTSLVWLEDSRTVLQLWATDTVKYKLYHRIEYDWVCQ